jgi:hypothetical protein
MISEPLYKAAALTTILSLGLHLNRARSPQGELDLRAVDPFSLFRAAELAAVRHLGSARYLHTTKNSNGLSKSLSQKQAVELYLKWPLLTEIFHMQKLSIHLYYSESNFVSILEQKLSKIWSSYNY